LLGRSDQVGQDTSPQSVLSCDIKHGGKPPLNGWRSAKDTAFLVSDAVNDFFVFIAYFIHLEDELKLLLMNTGHRINFVQ
jgi:hypothetical protein